MRSITKQIAFVCILLTVWSAVAFVSHHHSSTADALKCTGLRGRAFILSQADFHAVEQEVRSGIYFTVSTRFCQAAPRSLCPQRSPTSCSLEIEFKRSNNRVLLYMHSVPIS